MSSHSNAGMLRSVSDSRFNCVDHQYWSIPCVRVSESFASKCANKPAFYVLAILELVFVRQSARGESRLLPLMLGKSWTFIGAGIGKCSRKRRPRWRLFFQSRRRCAVTICSPYRPTIKRYSTPPSLNQRKPTLDNSDQLQEIRGELHRTK